MQPSACREGRRHRSSHQMQSHPGRLPAAEVTTVIEHGRRRRDRRPARAALPFVIRPLEPLPSCSRARAACPETTTPPTVTTPPASTARPSAAGSTAPGGSGDSSSASPLQPEPGTTAAAVSRSDREVGAPSDWTVWQVERLVLAVTAGMEPSEDRCIPSSTVSFLPPLDANGETLSALAVFIESGAVGPLVVRLTPWKCQTTAPGTGRS